MYRHYRMYILNYITNTMTGPLNTTIIFDNLPTAMIIDNITINHSAPIFFIINSGIICSGGINATGGSINFIGNNTNGLVLLYLARLELMAIVHLMEQVLVIL